MCEESAPLKRMPEKERQQIDWLRCCLSKRKETHGDRTAAAAALATTTATTTPTTASTTLTLPRCCINGRKDEGLQRNASTVLLLLLLSCRVEQLGGEVAVSQQQESKE